MNVAGGIEQVSIQSKMTLYEEIGKDLCTHLIQPFFENIDEGDLTTEASLFYEPHRKDRSSPTATTSILEYLVTVSSR